jgi:hypothetical protein
MRTGTTERSPGMLAKSIRCVWLAWLPGLDWLLGTCVVLCVQETQLEHLGDWSKKPRPEYAVKDPEAWKVEVTCVSKQAS